MQGVKEKALELLSSGKAQRVLGWKKGEFFYDLTPGVFESAEEVEREFEYGVFAGANLSRPPMPLGFLSTALFSGTYCRMRSLRSLCRRHSEWEASS